MPSVGHAPGPPPLAPPTPIKKDPVETMLGDMQLRSGDALAVTGLLSGLQLARPLRQKKKGLVAVELQDMSCGVTLEVAFLVSDMQLARPLSRHPLRQNKSQVVTMLGDMQVAVRCGTCSCGTVVGLATGPPLSWRPL